MPRLLLEGPRPYTIFCFTFKHYDELRNQNIWLVPRSVVTTSVFCAGSRAKKKIKNVQQRTLSSFITITHINCFASMRTTRSGAQNPSGSLRRGLDYATSSSVMAAVASPIISMYVINIM